MSTPYSGTNVNYRTILFWAGTVEDSSGRWYNWKDVKKKGTTIILFYISRLSQQTQLLYLLVDGHSSVILQTRLQIPNMDSDIFLIRRQRHAM